MTSEDAYTTAVDLLREVTRNRAEIGAQAVNELPAAGTEVDPDELQERATEKYETVLRPMEDDGLRVLQGLLRACDYDEVFRAVKEADAGWLYPIMLDRALGSVTTEGDDA